MDYVFLFNAFEVVLWTVVGGILLWRAFSQPSHRLRFVLAGIAFWAFAGTDLVEMRTGAWWRPWWLLAWKANCVVVLVTLGLLHYRGQSGNFD